MNGPNSKSSVPKIHFELASILKNRRSNFRGSTVFSLNIFYFQQITSYTVQYIQFIRKLGLERKRKLIEFFSYYRVHCDMEGGLYHINS